MSKQRVQMLNNWTMTVVKMKIPWKSVCEKDMVGKQTGPEEPGVDKSNQVYHNI